MHPSRAENGLRVRVVLETLGHLPSLFSEHDSVHNDVLERLVSENREGVKPAARLIQAFGDEVGWKQAAMEMSRVFKEKMNRRIPHAPRLEPALLC